MYLILKFILLMVLFVNAHSQPEPDALILYSHVEALTTTPLPRNYINIGSLNLAAEYIDSVFTSCSTRVEHQDFTVNGNQYRNIICSFGPVSNRRLVIGAHYDVCGDQPGADDNASAVAGLLELARLIANENPELNLQVDLVAYSLEEPPFFATTDMGSAHHARALVRDGVEVELMICLEMIGYFRDGKGSQSYPTGLLELFYPDRGNFIAVASNFGSHFKARKVRKAMERHTEIAVEQISAPRNLTGIDFSDHRNYWECGYDAVMITDTAFYRNPNYHQDSDTIDTLDFDRMAQVVKGVYFAVVKLAE